MKDEFLVNAGIPKGFLMLNHEVVVCSLVHLPFPHLLYLLLHRGQTWVAPAGQSEAAQSVLHSLPERVKLLPLERERYLPTEKLTWLEYIQTETLP